VNGSSHALRKKIFLNFLEEHTHISTNKKNFKKIYIKNFLCILLKYICDSQVSKAFHPVRFIRILCL
jgi:hypothetical protein